MQKHFNSVFNTLDRQLDTATEHFKAMQHLSSIFTTIPTPRDLLAVLKDSRIEYDHKDRLLYELIRLKQDNGPLSSLAGTLLLLAMRPVLYALCMNLDRMIKNPPDTLNDVISAFFKTIQSWNQEKTDRVPANLKWSTRECVMTRIRQEQKEREWLAREMEEGNRQVFRYRSPDHSWQSSDIEIRDLKRKLRSILDFPPRDIDLLILRLVMDSPWQVVGVKTGMKPESARKRCRLLKRKLAAMNLAEVLTTEKEGC